MKKYTFAGLIIFLLLASFYFVRLEKIEIVGNKEEWSTAENIREELFSDNISKSSLLNLVSELIGVHRKATFVDQYDIEWKSPASIIVHIHNKNIVGCVQYVGSFMYFDKDGIVVENSSRKLSGIPLVEGLEFSAVYLYEEMEMYDKVAFKEILEIIRNLNSYSIDADQLSYKIISKKSKEEFEKERQEEELRRTQKSEEKKAGKNKKGSENPEEETAKLMTEAARQDMITIEDTIIVRDQLTIQLKELTVNLGSTDLLSGKLSELKGMLENISDMRGIVHLEHYEGKDGNNYFTFERK